jgi:hypothetical protein
MGRTGRTATAVLVVTLLVAAGIGWVYLLRGVGPLDVGPRVDESLALERLAHEDGQPLLLLLAVWLPTAACAAVALAGLTDFTRAGRALLGGTVSFIALFVIDAASDAVTESERFVDHLSPQATRVAQWLPPVLFAVLCALIPAASDRARRRRRGRAAGSRRPPADDAAGA